MERYNPDPWTNEFAFLKQPGQADIQSGLFYGYRTNLDAYPKLMPTSVPVALIVLALPHSSLAGLL